MDFDLAAQRLARDHEQRRRRQRQRHGGRGGVVSAEAQRQVQLRKQAHERALLQKQRQEHRMQVWQSYMRDCDRQLHVTSLLPSTTTTTTRLPAHHWSTIPHLELTATSIHGDGDKIALPPSVLEHLTTTTTTTNQRDGTPWIFRIAVRNPNYTSFPHSPQIQALEPRNDDDDDDMDVDDNDDDTAVAQRTAPYVDELSQYYYRAWTHGTVVEFTQDEGCIGLPHRMASTLIGQSQGQVPVRRTVDPAAAAVRTTTEEPLHKGVTASAHEEEGHTTTKEEEEEEYHTSGHLAWGAFDVPAVPIEVSLVHLPKGRACTLQPTAQAITAGFYHLPNVKLVLEQSLIRTRAVLSVHDSVETWHRGVCYPLIVTHVEPATYHAVVCLDTDLTVDFAPPPTSETTNRNTATQEAADSTTTTTPSGGGGHVLGQRVGGDSSSSSQPQAPQSQSTSVPTSVVDSSSVLPDDDDDEPAVGTPNVCTVQIRTATRRLQRRFVRDTTTLTDLFAWITQQHQQQQTANFQLVTRLPRRVLTLQQQADATLQELEFGTQELWWLELLE